MARGRGPGRHSADPFGLEPRLFEYLVHVEQDGEVFAGYRLKGRPMVLCSAEDGTALASIHLHLAMADGAESIIAEQPDNPEKFHGVLTEDGRDFCLAMTNLTTDGVLMMDIGGDARTVQADVWERSDRSFWSGSHLNNNRLNRSNILWPMVPNVCDDNKRIYDATGECRRLQLLARAADADGGSAGVASRYPIFVYPKFGGRAVRRFQRTFWKCPETIVVVGTPQLMGLGGEEYNIQLERPQGPTGPQKPGTEGVVESVAASLGVTADKLLAALQIDREFLSNLPPEMAHEALMAQMETVDVQRLLGEQTKIEEPSRTRSSSSTVAGTGVVAGAREADIVGGQQMLRPGGSRLLIEKFKWDHVSAPAALHFCVHEQLQVQPDEAMPADERVTLAAEVKAKLEDMTSGRRGVLIERIGSVYQNPECVICMEPGPDAVLYQCGHRCVHLRCVTKERLRRCPLCRSPIAAVLPEAAVQAVPATPPEA